MPDGGLLSIACDATENFLVVRFTDTGKGIPTENLRQVLDPYFTTKTEGTGLGLLIVERIIRAHGGQLGIESSEGDGTSFILRLPLRDRQSRLLEAASLRQKDPLDVPGRTGLAVEG